LKYSIIFSLFVFMMASGCATVGPDYSTPDIEVADTWHSHIAEQMDQGAQASLQKWWTAFNDPVLNNLIQRANDANLDLKTAVSRIRQARAQLIVAGSNRLPNIDINGQASKSRQSNDGILQPVAPPGGFDSQNLFELGVSAGWEIDLFGRVRRLIETAQAQYQATVEAQRDVKVSLFAEVALAYVRIREYQNRIVSARNNAETQKRVMNLTKERFQDGLTSRLDVVQANANYASTQAVIPLLLTLKNKMIDRLAVLLGLNPGILENEFITVEPIPRTSDQIVIGVPADLLRQRPDIRSAERLLAAQTASIGVATADLYPSFSLNGFLGLQSRSLSDLFNTGSKMWGVSVPVNWNVFSGGKIKGNIQVQEEKAEQALLFYHQSILEALAEVNDAMTAYAQGKTRLTSLNRAEAAIGEAVELVLVQYKTGLTQFNNVMLMQSNLFVIQGQVISAKATLTVELITLYKSMGGGW
jgi:multidrug efflux system outer membrane protein